MTHRAKMLSKMVDELMGLNELKKKRKSYRPSQDPDIFRNSKTIACYHARLDREEKAKNAAKKAKLRAKMLKEAAESRRLIIENARKQKQEKQEQIAKKAEAKLKKAVSEKNPTSTTIVSGEYRTLKTITKSGYVKYTQLCSECDNPAKYKYLKDARFNKCEKCKWPNMVSMHEVYKLKIASKQSS
jgi:hypothetical protein